MMIIEYRRMRAGDEAALWDAVYFAMHVPPGEPEHPRALIHTPPIQRYFPDLGLEPDLGYLASNSDGSAIGAAWLRTWPGEDKGYGYVADDIPELSIAVWPGQRGKGIGTALLDRLFVDASKRWRAISLSTAKTNPAYRLYQRLGFATISEDGDAYLMVRRRAPDTVHAK